MSLPSVTGNAPAIPAPARRRRRGQGNPLLLKIFGIAVLIHLIGLPILAHFGAFKKVQQQFMDTRLVVLPPPEKEKVVAKPDAKKAQPKVVRHAQTNLPHPAAPASGRSALAQPKVVAVAGGSENGGDDSGPSVDANGSGVAGQLPGTATVPAPTPTPASEPVAESRGTETAEKPAPAPRPVIAPSPIPSPTPEATPRPLVYTEAVPLEQIKPSIPDSLRTEALDASVVIEFSVGPDGVPTRVKISESSNNPDLDDLGLKTARQWRFKPATRDGEPVETVVRLHIAFQVN